ncbi:MAG: hypothetical protein EOP34_09085 [Rickettsiales bacterium]|nr:MAG: hypothetical protein EOP34_09085 [Rickettsiales bacterium]
MIILKKVIVSLLAFAIILPSCSKSRKVEKAIEGWWSIDTIYYKNRNIRICLGNNVLQFRKGDNSELPAAKNNCGSFIKDSYSTTAHIEVLESELANDTIPLRLKIVTKNEIFAGTHKIVFYKDELNQLLKMEVYSDSLYIVCRKGLFNLSSNLALVNELEKISWTTRPKSAR